jgi:hypothetical protein
VILSLSPHRRAEAECIPGSRQIFFHHPPQNGKLSGRQRRSQSVVWSKACSASLGHARDVLGRFCAWQLKAKDDFNGQVQTGLGDTPLLLDTHEADRLSTAAATPPEASLSPALLARARSVAAEHAKLAAQSAESYDVAMAKRMGELGPVTTALTEWQEAQHVCCYPHSSKMQRCTASLTPCYNDTVTRRTPSAPLRPEQRRRAPLPRLGRHQRHHRHAHPAHYNAETHPDPAPPLRPPRLPRRAASGRRRL